MSSVAAAEQSNGETQFRFESDLWRVDGQTEAALRAVWPKIQPGLDGMLNDFYVFMVKFPELVPMLSDKGKIDCLKVLQKEHWQTFFQANFNEAYLNHVIGIGKTHARVELKPKYFLSGCSFMLERMLRIIIESNRRNPAAAADQAAALVRTVLMETEIALGVYVDATVATESRANMQALAEAFERELDEAVDFVRRGAKDMESAVNNVLDAASKVSEDSEHVTTASGHANENAATIAGASEELSASIAEISRQVEHSTAAARDAAEQSQGAKALAEDLAQVSKRIGSIVQLIERISKETRLLALNANIEAARAGDLGRGFAVVAHEVKTLADQTNNATGDIRNEIQAMQQAILNAIEAMGRVAERVQAVTGDISGIASAVTEQEAVTREIATNVGATAQSILTVHERISSVAQEADASTREANNLQVATRGMIDSVVGIKRRVIATLRSTRQADRRTEDRIAVDLVAKCTVGGKTWSGRTDNLSIGGAQIREAAMAQAISGKNAAIVVDMERVGTARGIVVATENDAVHIHFQQIDDQVARRLTDLLDRCRREDDEIIAIAKDTARRIGESFEEALNRKELVWDDLWDVEYQMIRGTDPAQYSTRFLPLCDRVLPGIQEPLLTRNARITFVVAVDRNGYLPVHNRQYSEPQRPGDRAWNTAHCRNRRMFDDRTGLAAARNRQPILVQTYRRDMGGGQFVNMKDISAPIMVNGQHWGGLRFGVKS
ncbi:MAG: hypothetical protein GC191_18625 [Azospirillum sp.]|nr:hypothetical protein [Azospirillum sp.]